MPSLSPKIKPSLKNAPNANQTSDLLLKDLPSETLYCVPHSYGLISSFEFLELWRIRKDQSLSSPKV
jgi:hypothetical protein